MVERASLWTLPHSLTQLRWSHAFGCTGVKFVIAFGGLGSWRWWGHCEMAIGDRIVGVFCSFIYNWSAWLGGQVSNLKRQNFPGISKAGSFQTWSTLSAFDIPFFLSQLLVLASLTPSYQPPHLSLSSLFAMPSFVPTSTHSSFTLHA